MVSRTKYWLIAISALLLLTLITLGIRETYKVLIEATYNDGVVLRVYTTSFIIHEVSFDAGRGKYKSVRDRDGISKLETISYEGVGTYRVLTGKDGVSNIDDKNLPPQILDIRSRARKAIIIAENQRNALKT